MCRGDTADLFDGQKKSIKVAVPFNIKDKDTFNPAGPGRINVFAFKIQEAAKDAKRPPCKHGVKGLILPFRIVMAVPGILNYNAITAEALLVDSTDDIDNT
jgi:hypothetical protein